MMSAESNVQQSIDVIKAPFEPAVAEHEKLDVEGAEAEKLVSCPCYTVCKATVNGTAEFDWNQPFVDISVLDGEGSFDGTPVKKGTHLIVPAGYGKMKAEGKNLMMIYSYKKSGSFNRGIQKLLAISDNCRIFVEMFTERSSFCRSCVLYDILFISVKEHIFILLQLKDAHMHTVQLLLKNI